MEQIPYIAHEADMTRMERTIRRVWILCIILIIALVGSNAGWIYYESQFEDISTSVEQEVDTGEGDATVIGVGDYYGEDQADSDSENQKTEDRR